MKTTTVVSGIPRSGTSLMMQMLTAGGMEALADHQRAADVNNPRGYYELESIKSLARNSEVISQADGKVVKVVSSLLKYLPQEHQYNIIFMRRNLEEIISSQDRMLERLGEQVPAAPKYLVVAAYERHLKEIFLWLSGQGNMSVLNVEYSAVLQDSREESSRIAEFLQTELNIDAMVEKVDQSLHRERAQVTGV